ncbi:MAG: Holliday junction branch migration protein RuvA [Pseudomonadales bacterium]|nr:Holliday junction branch migration protein RuvA [Pseudomonadales bacterium]
MLGRLRGTVAEVDAEQRTLLLEVRDVGYELHVSERLCSASDVGREHVLFVHADIKEDAHTLYGFRNKSERELFRTLLGVGGVGARSASALLSRFTEAELVGHIVEEDVKSLASVRGIGPKTARVIVATLKDRVDALAAAVQRDDAGVDTIVRQATDVLVQLGLRRGEAASIAKRAWTDGMELEELVTEILRISTSNR